MFSSLPACDIQHLNLGFFVKKSNKYYHCVYHYNGEHKKYKIQNSYIPNPSEHTKYNYLKSNIALFDNAKCNISDWKVTYRKMLKNWRHLNKTSYMKEVLQQLKLGEKNEKSNGNFTS